MVWSAQNSQEPEDSQNTAPVWGLLRRLGAHVIDIVLPPVCVSCRGPVLSHGLLCGTCWSGIDFICEPLCDRLGLPLPFAAEPATPQAPLLSVAARLDPPLFDRTRAVAQYSAIMRDLVHDFKFRDRQEMLGLFGRWMESVGQPLIAEADLLIPVPLYWGRLWARRFNQAGLLAQHLSKSTGLPLALSVLRRTRPTKQQVGLTMKERKTNVADAFIIGKAQKQMVRGKSILLIDDVITTGATAEACAVVLKQAGARRVDVLALARVTDPLSINV